MMSIGSGNTVLPGKPQFRCPVYLAEATKLILMFREVTLRIRKLRPIESGLEVKVEGRADLPHFKCEGGFSHLARPEDRNGGLLQTALKRSL